MQISGSTPKWRASSTGAEIQFCFSLFDGIGGVEYNRTDPAGYKSLDATKHEKNFETRKDQDPCRIEAFQLCKNKGEEYFGSCAVK